jgi:hypothetical protein
LSKRWAGKCPWCLSLPSEQIFRAFFFLLTFTCVILATLIRTLSLWLHLFLQARISGPWITFYVILETPEHVGYAACVCWGRADRRRPVGNTNTDGFLALILLKRKTSQS